LALAIAAVTLLVMTSAAPAFAAASLKANQVGQQTSGVNQSDPGKGGYVTSGAAKSGEVGDIARHVRL